MKRQSFFVAITIFMVLGLLAVFSRPAAATETYQVDPVHSAAVFRIKHLGIAYLYGRFNDLAGTLKIDDKTPANSVVEIYAKTKNIDTFNSERDNHLRSPDFFDAKKFDIISFKSKSFTKVSKDMYEVTGDLALHGVTRPLTVKVQRTGSGKDPWGGFRIGFETTFTIRRSDFGMNFMMEGVGDEVRIILSIEGIRQ
jgi:polyisoprenoid-binding protein YceI